MLTSVSATGDPAIAAITGLAPDAFLEWVAEALLECPRERTLPPALDSGVKDPDSSIGCICFSRGKRGVKVGGSRGVGREISVDDGG